MRGRGKALPREERENDSLHLLRPRERRRHPGGEGPERSLRTIAARSEGEPAEENEVAAVLDRQSDKAGYQ